MTFPGGEGEFKMNGSGLRGRWSKNGGSLRASFLNDHKELVLIHGNCRLMLLAFEAKNSLKNTTLLGIM